MTKRDIFGLYAAMITPFQASGTPDIDRAAQHAKALIDEGCDGLTLFGTTGEGYGISASERHEVQQAVREALEPDTSICVGILSSDAAGAADQALSAYRDGATHLLMAPPFFMKGVTDDGLFNWFSDVFQRIGAQCKNIIMYHIPSQTGVPLSSDLIARLRTAFPDTIVGIKDSSGNWEATQDYLANHGDLAVLVGDERLLPKAMAHGAQGSICGTANFMPARLRQIIHNGDQGEIVCKVVDLVVANPVNPAVKLLTAHVRNDAAFKRLRAPLVELPTNVGEQLIREFDALTID
ncbi:dihydrodipicolinate synthase family protein [Maritalea mediterranea]|uniref:Dihydrodipicolinate synthase family protein n=1 Tax=Maritalea mediterranea TaxID=2909667 RepID=A0ABS9E8W9_9HYPH|nr:dihydrodipicolinate synthase family protein [Maritalea mediterranea]MCF4099335.1 dihydrodipicolinate synthase family protein [Maritalea mediterranea]